jgi:hypothetical protein
VLAGKRKWKFRVPGLGRPAARSLAGTRLTAAGLVVFAGWRSSDCSADSGCLFRRASWSLLGGRPRFAAVAVGLLEAVVARAVARDWFAWVAATGM